MRNFEGELFSDLNGQVFISEYLECLKLAKATEKTFMVYKPKNVSLRKAHGTSKMKKYKIVCNNVTLKQSRWSNFKMFIFIINSYTLEIR